MADEEKGIVAAGFRLLWRRQGVLWWVFVVNAICAALATGPALMHLKRALGHTLAGEKLSSGFDLGMLAEVMRLPEATFMRIVPVSHMFAIIFLVFMLFAMGGIVESYRQDRRLTTGEFFAAAGACFWRFFRLALISIIPFMIVMAIYQGLSKVADKVGDRAIADQVGVFLGLAAFVIFLLLALWVRLWFDIAQVRALVVEEGGMWRNALRSWKITWRNQRQLYRAYICISLVAWVVLALGAVIWAHLGPKAMPLTFLVLEFIVFVQLMTRLWLVSTATTWYLRNPEPVPVMAVVEVVEVAPIVPPETIEPEPLPPGTPDPELPPADA
jgi:hypothetical protein